MTIDYAQLRGLMQEVYGSSPAEAELEWWFERNPVGQRILSVVEGEGASALSLFRLVVEGEERLGAFIVHAVTTPAARGRGVFSRLQLENEEKAAEAGASVVLGFTTDMATRVLVGWHRWERLARPRVWARPRLSRRRAGLRTPPLRAFTDEDATALAGGPTRLLKDAAYLDWRYRDSPRPYGRVDADAGFAVVGIGRHGGLAAGAVCELAGGARVLRRAAKAVDARVVLGLPNRDERGAYFAAGFLPTPWRLHLIGKRLDPDAPLPRDWRLSLGDLDFF